MATILTRKDKPDFILHFHLGTDSEHTIYKAKLVGMLLAIYLIDTKEHSATFCLIAVDNQATLKAFTSDMHHPGHHIVWEFLNLANCTHKHCSKCKYRLTLR